jgi:oligosaccharyltransferase complex subunit alpha (ribophorin I)
MFGGWQTQFYIGYSVPTETALFVDPETGRHSLKFDFFTIFEEVWVDDMEIKVVLPEGCTDIKVEVPYEVETTTSKRYVYSMCVRVYIE